MPRLSLISFGTVLVLIIHAVLRMSIQHTGMRCGFVGIESHAIEALHEGWRAKRFTMDELWEAAKVCCMQRVMQTYLEMLVQ